MDGEKVVVQPPPYKMTESRKPLLLSVAVACVSATALVVVCVLGGIYIQDLKQRGPHTSTPEAEAPATGGKMDKSVNIHVEVENEGITVSETRSLDRARHEEVDLQYDESGQLTQVTVRDFSTKIYGVYSVSQEKCYIFPGGDMGGEDMEAMEQSLQEQSAEVLTNSSHLNFYMDGKPVTDHSILPDNLQPYCKGKSTHWVRPSDQCEEAQDHGRQKRCEWDWYWCVGCPGWCPGATFCGYWFYYICV